MVADAGGSKSLIIDKENGFLTKPRDYQDVTKKVNILLDNDETREQMRKIALKFSKDFTWEKVFNKLLKMYQKLL